MTRGDKFIHEMTAKGLDEKQLRWFVTTGDCQSYDALKCEDCPCAFGLCADEDVVAYFEEEVSDA